MTGQIVVTRATPQDTRRIARLLDEWFAHSAIAWPEPDPTLLADWVLHTIENGYVVVAEKDGRLLGVAGVQPCYLPWNTETPMLRDAFFFVPRARSTNELSRERVERAAQRAPGVADALMTAVKLYAAKQRMPLVMEVISGADTERVERWYRIKGGTYAGGTFVFGLPEKAED